MSQFGDEESRKAWKKGKLDRNGYAESIMGTERGICFYCHRIAPCDRHEIFGKYSRQYSKEDGLWVYLCKSMGGCKGCHSTEHEVGLEFPGGSLKQLGQMAYERTHTREEFMKRYGRNYL